MPISLIRYLILWKVNSSLVFLPRCFPIELSLVLGTMVGNRLATQEAGPWRKTLARLAAHHAQIAVNKKKASSPVPDITWPLEVTLLAYPTKRTFGQGELIIWELKLFGESADHDFFLELLLPAMEEAGYTSDPQWNRSRRLWGHFDVFAVYVAKGPQWEPLVQEGRLDLRYRPTPIQWAEGLTFRPEPPRTFKALQWLTPFDLSAMLLETTDQRSWAEAEQETRLRIPNLQMVMNALIARATRLLSGRHKSHDALMAALNSTEQASLNRALEESAQVRLLKEQLAPAPKKWPGAWIGTQTYSRIPDSIIPYLELASILHIGKYTHFGCGTFRLA